MLADMMRYGTESGKNIYDGRDLGLNYHPMMWGGANSSAFWFFGILCVITWIMVIIVLFALARWLWEKGDKVR